MSAAFTGLLDIDQCFEALGKAGRKRSEFVRAMVDIATQSKHCRLVGVTRNQLLIRTPVVRADSP
eukprot:6647824-Alexandrium_andersonii.AAC.1